MVFVKNNTLWLFPFALVFLQFSSANESADSRIVSGKNATLGQFPYYASILADGEHGWGGAILNDRWILTTAQSIHTGKFEVVVGSIVPEQGKKYGISKIIRHPNFVKNVTHVLNDIALFKTSERIIFNENVKPIELSFRYIDGNEEAVTCGFGFTESGIPKVLQYVEEQTLNHSTCAKMIPKNGKVLTKDMLCTSHDIFEGICHFDFGGPLVVNEELVGIASHTAYRDYCSFGYPDIFTRVSSYLDWIISRIGLDQETYGLGQDH